MRIAFITNLSAHYNIGTFELLAKQYTVDFFFFSDASEWYWPREHRLREGNFHFENLRGFRIGGTRITPSLPGKLLRGNYDIFIKCINGKFALPATFLIAKITGTPFILWTGIWNRIETRLQKILFPLTRYIYRHADAIVVYGEHVKQYLIHEGVAAERVFVAHHAVDNDFYGEVISSSRLEELRTELNIPTEKKVILYLGRLEESKGLPYLVEAFKLLSHADSILLIAGEGSLRSALENSLLGSGVADNVRFVGYVPIETTPVYYALAWVYVLPSITVPTGKEPWGLVVNEAFNQGVPVIATDVVGAAAGGLVQDGVNGFVIPEKDSQTLALRLHELVVNPTLRHELSHNAKRIITSWNYDLNIRGYISAIDYVSRRGK